MKRRKKSRDNLRQQLGISQDHMALWLGVSRSLYSMYESNRRSLPTQAVLKYVQILQAWEKFQTEWVAPEGEKPPPTSEDQLFAIKVVQHKLNLARFALSDLDDAPDYRKARAFFENLQTQTTDPKEQVIFDIQIRGHEEDRQRIESERKRLSAEIQLLEKKLELLQSELPE